MTFLGLAVPFKTMNRLDPARPDPIQPGPTVTFFDDLFLGKYEKNEREILTQFSFIQFY